AAATIARALAFPCLPRGRGQGQKAEQFELEGEADAGRGDRDGLHADVLVDGRPGAGPVLDLDGSVSQRTVGLQVAESPVEDEAGGEAVGEGHVPLSPEEVALTLRPARLPRLPAYEVRLETSEWSRGAEGTRVHP